KNPNVVKFRKEDLKHLDEMMFLFEDVSATGVGAWVPSQDINDSYNYRDNDEDNDDEEEGLEDKLNDESTPPSAMRQKRRKVGRGNKRSGASQFLTQLKHIINVFEEEKANEIAHKNNVLTKRKKKTTTLITIATCVDYFLKYVVKNPQRTSRMKNHVFLNFYDILQNTYNLKITK
ncbi:hypothetical protein S83_047213, partial [Arachis hypogaea]